LSLDTVVTWTLAKVDGGTRLRVVHRGFVLPKNATTFRNLSEGWKTVVGKIDVISGGRSQLIVYHFMFAPDWEEGCKSCSFWADNFNGIPIHLNHRDVTFTAVSRAPLAKISAYKKRMGWSFPWVSSYGNDFNLDYHVSFTPEQIAEGKAYYNYGVRPNTVSDEQGISVFCKNERGDVPHLFLPRAGHRHGQWCLPFPRPCAQRPR